MATYLHAIDGRLRVRLPQIRGSRRAAARIRRDMRTLDGIEQVDANPMTGSVLVEYDESRLSTDDLLDHLNVDLPPDAPKQGTVLKKQQSQQQTKIKDIVLEKAIELAAERLLLAVIA